MSVQRGLERLREIILTIAERPDCAEITRYDKIALNCFVEALDKAINRYKSEAARIRKYTRVY